MGQKAILMAGLLTVALFACGGPFSMEETAGGEGALSGSQALQSGDGSACSMERSCAVLYIGVGNQFAEYPVEYTGELDENGQIPPEEVVSAMASLTGWSLDLAEPIFSGKGGITVSFADTSALFVGPPEEQREEFRVYDALQLDQTILDSLKKTLQCWAVDSELGDPDQVDVWFCGADGGAVDRRRPSWDMTRRQEAPAIRRGLLPVCVVKGEGEMGEILRLRVYIHILPHN